MRKAKPVERMGEGMPAKVKQNRAGLLPQRRIQGKELQVQRMIVHILKAIPMIDQEKKKKQIINVRYERGDATTDLSDIKIIINIINNAISINLKQIKLTNLLKVTKYQSSLKKI